MKKLVSKILIFLLSMVCFSGCAGGGNSATYSDSSESPSAEGDTQKLDYVITEKGTPKPVYSKTYSWLGGKSVMPIGTYCGPTAKMLNDEYFTMIKELGVNFFASTLDGGSSVEGEDALKLLELSDKYRFGVFLTDSGLRGADKASLLTPAIIDSHLKNYIKYNSFLGVELKDEPSSSELPELRKTVDNYKNSTYGSEYDLYYNALPDYAFSGDSTGEIYEKYCRDFIEILQAEYFSYDNYVFGSGLYGYNQTYFENMATARNLSEEYEIPFWTFIQTGVDHGWKVELTKPDEEGFRWNVNTCLAYGAKGIQYFTLVQWEGFVNDADPDKYSRLGFFGANLQKNQWYDFGVRINKHIADIDEVLMNAANMGVIFTGASPVRKSTGSEILTSFRQLESVSGDASLVGCFDYKGGTALYVVNNSMEKNGAKIILSFDNNYCYDVTAKGSVETYKGNDLTLTLDAGEGALVVLR